MINTQLDQIISIFVKLIYSNYFWRVVILGAGNVSFGLFLSQNLMHLHVVLLKIANVNNAWDFLGIYLINLQYFFIPKNQYGFSFFYDAVV